MLHLAVAQSSSGGVAICYELPVLWVTSYLPTAHNRPDKGGYSLLILKQVSLREEECLLHRSCVVHKVYRTFLLTVEITCTG